MAQQERLSTVLWRGFRSRCPNCGEGHLFRSFLKVVDRCEVCHEEYFHHRADDFPAYLVILVVGHIVVPLQLWMETRFAPSLVFQLALLLPLIGILTIGLLQPVKGMVVAVQWRAGMHGFSESKKAREAKAAKGASACA
jgi:uncharacterized protein (DUF983 family)